MFASKSPRDLNRDPEPYVNGLGHRFTRIGYSGYDSDARFRRRLDPRPEFDHVQHNGPNPILVAARYALAEGATYRDLYNDMIGYQIGYPGSDEMTIGLDRAFFFDRGEAMHAHARAVLTRLAKLSEGI